MDERSSTAQNVRQFENPDQCLEHEWYGIECPYCRIAELEGRLIIELVRRVDSDRFEQLEFGKYKDTHVDVVRLIDDLYTRIAELEGFISDLYATCPKEGDVSPTGSARTDLEFDFWHLNRKLLNNLEALRGEEGDG